MVFQDGLIYAIVGLTVFVMNTIPFFMPPTWLVLSFFYTFYKLSLLPTVIIGASAATLGRIVLYYLSRDYLRSYIPKRFLTHYDEIGDFFLKHERLTIPIVIGYAFFPIPSNQVFVIAGLSKLDIRAFSLAFLVGRLISYSFWITLSYHSAKYLDSIFVSHFLNAQTIVSELIGILLILLVGLINWKKIFEKLNLA